MSDLECDPDLLNLLSIMSLFTLGLGNNSGSLVGGLSLGCYKIFGSFPLAGIYPQRSIM